MDLYLEGWNHYFLGNAPLFFVHGGSMIIYLSCTYHIHLYL